RYRPDRLVFPPEVTSVFDNVRVETRAVVLVAPPDTEVSAGTGAFTFWVVASAFQTVEVTLRYQDGAPFRALYAGPMGDSLRVQWDGLDAAAQMPPVARGLLRVASRGGGGPARGGRARAARAPGNGRRAARGGGRGRATGGGASEPGGAGPPAPAGASRPASLEAPRRLG